MANKKISELSTAGTLTGPELVEVVQGGVNVKTTAQDIADLSGLSSLDVDTSPATLEFNFNSKVERIFICTPAFGGGLKTINLSNFSNAKKFSFIIDSTGDLILRFVAVGFGFRMDDVRWELGPDQLIEYGAGKFLGEATFDGADWFVKISGGPYVKT